MRAISLAISLFLFWLALSGVAMPGLVVVGAFCAVGCVAVAWRMGVIDAEGHPIHLVPRALTFLPWLAWEIAKSTAAVVRIVLDPQLPISPTMTRVAAGQRTALGVGIYANAITLTPGTITVGVNGSALLVHALTEAGAADLEGGAMDARVTRFEGVR